MKKAENTKLNKYRESPGIIKAVVLWALSAAFLAVMGCSTAAGLKTEQRPGVQLVFERVAVAPFQQSTPEQADINAADCSRCFVLPRTDAHADLPESIVERIFLDKLGTRYQLDVIPPERTAGMYERQLIGAGRLTPLELLKKVGRDMDVEAIIFGYVYRYRELRGMPYAAARPASVAFEIFVYRVSDGVLVWRQSFDRTQASLMEDVLQAPAFIRGGARWLTARELSERGMDDILQGFPARLK